MLDDESIRSAISEEFDSKSTKHDILTLNTNSVLFLN